MTATVGVGSGVRGGVGRTLEPMMVEPAAATEAFEAFYRRAWHDAARWATALVGSPAIGEEIAQDAFLRICARFPELENPDGYLRVTVVNLARSSIRSSTRRSSRERQQVTDGVTVAGGGENDLLASLDRLSYEQRAVLVLRYWADWDEPAIADALGCKASTVRSHARRALMLLRKDVER